jgi:Flp pilus assembly protein TadG
MQQVDCQAASRKAAPGALRRLLRRFSRDRNGATAVEFAMVSVPFLGLLFATFETAFVFLAQEGLDAATAVAARQLMTGQAQGNAAITSASQFANSLICNPTPPAQRILPNFINCANLIIDVSQATSFASANISKSYYTNPTTNYNPGGANCIVIVRVVYPMPAYLSILSANKLVSTGANNTSGQTLYQGTMSYILMSTAVFRNEPFPTNNYTAC